MRITLTIDDDVLAAARELARERGQTLGAVVSDLAREGLRRLANEREGQPSRFAEAQ